MLGHARSRQALHGGKAHHDQSAAPQLAVLLRGGMRPPADGSPAEMRATRDLRRRRMDLTRPRAELRGHGQTTTSQYHRPAIGKKLAYKAHRTGVAARLPDSAVQKRMAGDRARLGSDDALLRDLECPIGNAAKQHEAQTIYLLQTLPGIGNILSLVLRDAIQASARCPRVQACVAYCHLVKCAPASAGKRSGTTGTQLGKADLTGAVSEAAVRFLRENPAGQQSLARLEQKQGQGQALTLLAHQLARAVSDMLQRGGCLIETRFALAKGVEQARLRPHWGPRGAAWRPGAAMVHSRRRRTPMRPEARSPDPARLIGRLLPLPSNGRTALMVTGGCPSPEPGTHWRTAMCRPACEADGLRGALYCEGAACRATALCNHHRAGGSPSSRVRGSPIRAAPGERHPVRTQCQRMTAPGARRRQTSPKSALRDGVSLDNGGPHKGWV